MNRVYIGILSLGVLLITSCMSSGPATSYYSLFANKNIAQFDLDADDISIGVGPIILPEYIENPSVVSLSTTQQVRISGYHAWAGGLKEAMSRVLAQDISSALGLDQVWAFPWDNRVRPNYQIRIVFEEFSGIRGSQVSLRAKWTLLNQRGDEILISNMEQISTDSTSDSVGAYVSSLNYLLGQLSENLAKNTADYLNNK